MRRVFFIGSLLTLGSVLALGESRAITYYNSGNSCIRAYDNFQRTTVHDNRGTWVNSSTGGVDANTDPAPATTVIATMSAATKGRVRRCNRKSLLKTCDGGPCLRAIV